MITDAERKRIHMLTSTDLSVEIGKTLWPNKKERDEKTVGILMALFYDDKLVSAIEQRCREDAYFRLCYAEQLTEVVTGLKYSTEVAAENIEYVTTATTRERAEAFLLALKRRELERAKGVTG